MTTVLTKEKMWEELLLRGFQDLFAVKNIIPSREEVERTITQAEEKNPRLRRHFQAFRLHFGFGAEEPVPYKELALRMGVCKSRARTLSDFGLGDLKRFYSKYHVAEEPP